jgi:beta-glucosidase
VVLNTGGPVLMPWLRDVGAVLQAWYPGERFGAAIAAVLFGDADPGGRLPVTFPAGDDQGPAPPTRPQRYPGIDGVVRYEEGIHVGYRWYDTVGQEPLFPFGHGLSYARFNFSKLRVDVDRSSGSVRASVRAKNTGRRRGSTVAQLYIEFPPAANEPPRQLKGYAKVELDPGRTTDVGFELERSDLAYFDESTSSWVVADGRYTLFVGSSSRDLHAHRSLHVDGSG